VCSSDLDVEASWQHFSNSAFEPNNGEGVALPDDPIQRADVNKDVTTDTFRLAGAFHPAANRLIDASVTFYSSQTDIEEYDAVLDRITIRDIATVGVNARNASRFQIGDIDATLTLGADWYRDEQSGRDSANDDGARGGVPDGEQEFYGAFVQLEASIDRPFGLPGDVLVIPGVRLDSFKSAANGVAQGYQDDAISPRLAASYGPVGWLRLFASYAEGFRAPSINELYLDGVHFSVPHPTLFNPAMGQFVFVNNNFVPNPNLRPEDAATIEVGAGVNFRNLFATGDQFQARASYYQSDVDGLIDLAFQVAFDPSCYTAPSFLPCTAGTTNASNVANARLTGVEIEASFKSERLIARAAFSTIDGTDRDTGVDLGVLAPDRLSLDVRWLIPEWNAAVGSRLHAAADFQRTERDRSGNTIVADERDSYAVIDLYATWRPSFIEGLRIDAGVDNVFDQNYERVFQGVSEPGANPRIAISWTTAR